MYLKEPLLTTSYSSRKNKTLWYIPAVRFLLRIVNPCILWIPWVGGKWETIVSEGAIAQFVRVRESKSVKLPDRDDILTRRARQGKAITFTFTTHPPSPMTRVFDDEKGEWENKCPSS